MDGARMRIMVVDRNVLVAEALVALFAELVGDAEISVAHSLEAAADRARRDRPDLVVIDAWIGRADPAAAVRKLVECSPRSRIFVIATGMDGATEEQVLAAGAAGWRAKERLPDTAHTILEELSTAR